VVACHVLAEISVYEPAFRTDVARDVLGRLPVVTFFVLSGFVLNLSLPQQAPMTFLTRRFARIYLPYIAIMALLAIVWYVATPPHLTMAGPLSVPVVASATLMLPLKGRFPLDFPAWSLSVEMAFSIAFLPLAYAVRRVPALLLLALATSIAVMPKGGLDLGSPLYYGTAFVAGILLSIYRPQLYRAWWLAVPVLAVVGVRYDVAFFAAAALLVALVPTTFATVRPPIAWLGRVSYSLYLIHFPILVIAVRDLGVGWGLAVGLPLAFVLAHVSYMYVEAPFTAFGRRLTERKNAPGGKPEASAGNEPELVVLTV
jgi:peptidoglycan/LPS O-acetylase OafA/YrhL